MKKIVVTLLVLFSINVGISQDILVKGKLVDNKSKHPIAYATIKIVDSRSFTVSDSNGNFTIKTKQGQRAKIQHTSYKSVTLALTPNITINLEQSQIELNEITVKANPLKDISHSIVVNDTEKRISQPRSVGHLFKDIKGFGIVKRGAYASEPVFRSFKYEQLNVQYDGGMKILNACPNRMDPITTHVIPEEIEKIEIVKGPFTVRFGQNFGGIINLVSKNPTKYKSGFHGGVEGGYESNGNNFVTGANLMYVGKMVDVLLNGSYRGFGDYKDGAGTVVPSSFKTTDYSVKLGINPTENQRVQLSWRQSFGKDIDHAGLPMDSPYDDSYLAGLDYKWKDISEKVGGLSTKIFYSYVDHLMTNGGRKNFKMVDAQAPVEAWNWGGKAEIVFTPSENTNIYTGIDANFIKREGNRTRTIKIMKGKKLPKPKEFKDKIWQDAKLNTIGVFTEGKFKIADFYTLTTGIRADFVSSRIDDPAADFLALYNGKIGTKKEINISANAALKYRNEGLQAQLAIGRGVRTASMIERYINHFGVGIDPYEYVGNPNIKPEKNHQIELSVSKQFKTIELGASVFHSFLTDYISAKVNPNIPRKFMPTTPPTISKQFINLDKAAQTGIEFNFNYQPTEKWLFTSDISYTQSKNRDFKEPLPQIPPLMANLGAKYEAKSYWFSLSSRLVGAQNKMAKSFMEKKTPGFGTLDFRVGIKPYKGISLGAAVLNIFDKAYYEHLNYSHRNSNLLSGRIYEPGRNLTAYLKYEF